MKTVLDEIMGRAFSARGMRSVAPNPNLIQAESDCYFLANHIMDYERNRELRHQDRVRDKVVLEYALADARSKTVYVEIKLQVVRERLYWMTGAVLGFGLLAGMFITILVT